MQDNPMNRRLTATAPGVFEWQETAIPSPGSGEVLIRSRYGAVKHGTEFSMIKGVSAARGLWNSELQLHEGAAENIHSQEAVSPQPKVTVGNMICGDVEQVGPGVHNVRQGDRVYTYASFAQYVSAAQERTWKLPDVDWRSALCLDPARFAFAALRDGDLRLGDTVAVFGLGAIGLLSVQMAVLAGSGHVIALDPLKSRRAAAMKLGAHVSIDPRQGDTGRKIKSSTGGRGVDVAIELSGAAAALQAGLRGIAFGGTVVCAAFPSPYPAGLDFGAEAHMNRPQIVFSRAVSDPNRDHPRWSAARIEEHCRSLIESGRLDGPAIIDKVVPYENLKTEYRSAMDDPSTVIKLGVEFL